MKTIIFICNLSIIFSTTPFKGYIKHSGYSRSSYIYPYFYAEGQYLNGLMDGEWNFYSDSTKQYVVAKGGFLNGNTSNPSKYGIPKNGRHGLWEHYYTENERWRKNSPTLNLKLMYSGH